MKYPEFVKGKIRQELLRVKPDLSSVALDRQENEIFDKMLASTVYDLALSALPSDDPLKKAELEESEYFLDNHYDISIPRHIYDLSPYLFHGIRFDSNHEKLQGILQDEKIKCGKEIAGYYDLDSENSNDGKYVSLIEYPADSYDLEFSTFVLENVGFVISPKLNPEKCKYLTFEEWEKIKDKLPYTRHRYSYARKEYQHKGSIDKEYIVGLLYPYSYYAHEMGTLKAREDLCAVIKMLDASFARDLPIFDQSDFFYELEKSNFISQSPGVVKEMLIK